MRRAAVAALPLLVVLLGGCGVTLQDEPEPLVPSAGTPSPPPTVSVHPDSPGGQVPG
ncbi:hypothetical protein [Pseudonocardia sp. HH130630-07]|uniref:hypothetical protein n=1 Tax=Pseudonocardia sp. HH130630-07 TaxID=1690815 RepID=UPI0012E9DD05|nr:hypothetical protein [Pseudonocardia sp. HH130630-07]